MHGNTIDREVVELLERPVNVRKLVDRLFFQIEDMERAALKQPTLRLEAGRFRAQTSLRVASLKRRLGKIVGVKSIKIRKRSDTRTTEGAIKNVLSLDRKYQSAQKKLDTAEIVDEFAHQLIEAYKERTMMISVLTRLKASEISSQLAAVKGEEEVDKMRRKAKKVRDRFTELEGYDE